MRNHDEKVKDMSRSVLPSTARAGARYSRRQVHKRQRALELNGLTDHRKSAKGDSAKTDGIAPDFDGAYRGDIAVIVRERRFHDKDAPLVRWARATMEADPALREAPRAERIAYFARLMPPNLIGRHAVQHIEMVLDRPRECPCRRCADKRGNDRGARIAETERAARQILAAGLHGTLNARLRAAADRQADTADDAFPRRLLLGRHDVEAFASELGCVPKAREVIAAVAAMTRRR